MQDWDDLQDGGTYAPVGRELLEEKVKTIRRELRHLTHRREDELGNALALVAAEAEGVDPSQAMLLPEARQLAADEEVDALVRVKTPTGDVLFVASHKNHSNSKFALQEGAGAHWPPPAGRRQDASGEGGARADSGGARCTGTRCGGNDNPGSANLLTLATSWWL